MLEPKWQSIGTSFTLLLFRTRKPARGHNTGNSNNDDSSLFSYALSAVCSARPRPAGEGRHDTSPQKSPPLISFFPSSLLFPNHGVALKSESTLGHTNVIGR